MIIVRHVRKWKAYAQSRRAFKPETLENWYSDGWNEGVTPRSARLILRMAGSQCNRLPPKCYRARWSRQRAAVMIYESCPEVDGAAYMPGFGYPWSECIKKILTNFWKYGSKRWYCRKAIHLEWWYLWMSKIGCYESPCVVTGGAVINDQVQA